MYIVLNDEQTELLQKMIIFTQDCHIKENEHNNIYNANVMCYEYVHQLMNGRACPLGEKIKKSICQIEFFKSFFASTGCLSDGISDTLIEQLQRLLTQLNLED